VHLSSRFCGTIAGRQFARASENTLFAQEFPCRFSTDCVLLSHALDRLEERFELLPAHESPLTYPLSLLENAALTSGGVNKQYGDALKSASLGLARRGRDVPKLRGNNLDFTAGHRSQ
jgi:hypothetical protein